MATVKFFTSIFGSSATWQCSWQCWLQFRLVLFLSIIRHISTWALIFYSEPRKFLEIWNCAEIDIWRGYVGKPGKVHRELFGALLCKLVTWQSSIGCALIWFHRLGLRVRCNDECYKYSESEYEFDYSCLTFILFFRIYSKPNSITGPITSTITVQFYPDYRPAIPF